MYLMHEKCSGDEFLHVSLPSSLVLVVDVLTSSMMVDIVCDEFVRLPSSIFTLMQIKITIVNIIEINIETTLFR